MFLGFLLDIANFLSDLLQRVFISAILHLEVCGNVSKKPVFKTVDEDESRAGQYAPCCLFPEAACEAIFFSTKSEIERQNMDQPCFQNNLRSDAAVE